MAKFNVLGFDAFAADLEAAKELSTDEVFSILEAGGAVVLRAMRQKLADLNYVLTGRLRDSIEVVRRPTRGDPAVLIYPRGKHHSYHGRDSKGRRGKGGIEAASASEVGFVLNYGAPSRGIPAFHWMEPAVEFSGPETTEAMQEEFNAILDSKGVGR